MAKYKIQKFVNDNIPPPGVGERKIYWLAPKHNHDASIIPKIAKWLDEQHPPIGWKVRPGSFESEQSSPPNDRSALEYDL